MAAVIHVNQAPRWSSGLFGHCEFTLASRERAVYPERSEPARGDKNEAAPEIRGAASSGVCTRVCEGCRSAPARLTRRGLPHEVWARPALSGRALARPGRAFLSSQPWPESTAALAAVHAGGGTALTWASEAAPGTRALAGLREVATTLGPVDCARSGPSRAAALRADSLSVTAA